MNFFDDLMKSANQKTCQTCQHALQSSIKDRLYCPLHIRVITPNHNCSKHEVKR